jgi:hypothetical protein
MEMLQAPPGHYQLVNSLRFTLRRKIKEFRHFVVDIIDVWYPEAATGKFGGTIGPELSGYSKHGGYLCVN